MSTSAPHESTPERLRTLRPGVLALALLVVACGSEEDEPSAPALRDPEVPPHVLLISIDSLRADHLGCYGYETATGAPTSPRLDALAEQGVLFEQCVSTTSWTLPAHHSLLSGLPELLHGVSHDRAGPTPDRVCLPEALQRAGWETAGYFSGPYLHPAYGFGQGFPEQRYVNCGSPSLYDLDEEDPEKAQELEFQSWEEITSEVVSDHAIDFLRDHRQGSGAPPFFLFLHYFDVHYDFDPQPETWAKQFWADPLRRPPVNGIGFMANPAIHPDMDPAVLDGVISYYDGEIAWVDDQIGRVLDALDELELARDTLVVITSDHGDEFFEHGQKGHRNNLYQETLHVPLILRLPGTFDGGRRFSQRVSLIDVAPTILDLTGVEPEQPFEHPLLEKGMLGRSLLPITAGREGAGRVQLGMLADTSEDEATGRSHRWALWSGDRKVVVQACWEDGRGMSERRDLRGELYDLGEDPREQRNLATAPDRPGIAAIERHESLHRQLFELSMQMRTGLIPAKDAEQRRAMEEQLQALGYVPTETGSAQPPPAPFPRN